MKNEEDFLVQEFGDTYKRYRLDVRYRVIPGVFLLKQESPFL